MEDNGVKKPAGYYIKEEEKKPLQEILFEDEKVDNSAKGVLVVGGAQKESAFYNLSEEERKKLADEIMETVRIRKEKEEAEEQAQIKRIEKSIITIHKSITKHKKFKHQKTYFSHNNGTER